MMGASDFRAKAREALRGRWGVAIAVTLVAVLLGGGSGSGDTTITQVVENYQLDGFLSHQMYAMLVTISVVASLLALVIGGVMEFGLASFHIKLLRRQEVRFGTLFEQFYRIGAGICMVVLRWFFICLWSLLLVIPGIVASYRYAMMPYLMAEFPELGALDAMRESKRLMYGNKWRLFCLHLSFIGWILLCGLTFGIGFLWLNPYMEAAEAAFYLEICREDRQRQQADRQWGPGPELL